MSVESSADRLRKRIVEMSVSGFKDAESAIRFGNTVEKIISEKLPTFKFRQYIGSPETVLAITENYSGKTVLKMCFLEVSGNDASLHIVQQTERAIAHHNAIYSMDCMLVDQVIRGKPQPQYIG